MSWHRTLKLFSILLSVVIAGITEEESASLSPAYIEVAVTPATRNPLDSLLSPSGPEAMSEGLIIEFGPGFKFPVPGGEGGADDNQGLALDARGLDQPGNGAESAPDQPLVRPAHPVGHHPPGSRGRKPG